MRNILLILLVVVVAAGAYLLGASGRDTSISGIVGKAAEFGNSWLGESHSAVESPAIAAVDELVDSDATKEPVLKNETYPANAFTDEAEVATNEADGESAESQSPFDINAYNASRAAKRWAVYLDDKLSALEFIDYDVVVFDSHRHPQLRPLEHQGKALLARMNFFFLDGHESFYTKKETASVLFEEQKDGQSMKFVDIRNTEWLRIMIEKKIPHLTKMGFNGLLLEGVDDAVMLESRYPDKYFGMIEALGRFIRTVKQHFPYLKIMLKNSMHVTSIARDHVDMILFVQSNGSGLLSEGKQQERTYAWMGGVKGHVPDVEFYSLDFVDIENTSKDDVRALYAERREKGLIPYVAQEELERHYVEPF